MTTLTVRDLPDEVIRALRLQAKKNGRSREAELRAIITAAVLPPGRTRLGSQLLQIGHMAGGLQLRAPREAARPDE